MIRLSLAHEVIAPTIKDVVGCRVERVMVTCIESDMIAVDVLDESHSGTFDAATLVERLKADLGTHGIYVCAVGAPLPYGGETVAVQLEVLIDDKVEVRVSEPWA
ncbi:hypothetical protein ACTTAL_03560 [Rhodobacter capsulatus]|uniref:hypothetical protein n=1 Tax=Rhodobacter capsulatus TaxID=1061 RepID=UPI0003D39270|nr:hypothetical protein [Rhodobacter capsulatus]ETD89930.1 hypothetical protein U713_07330 [Rhodobacter capsulatus YW2]